MSGFDLLRRAVDNTDVGAALGCIANIVVPDVAHVAVCAVFCVQPSKVGVHDKLSVDILAAPVDGTCVPL